MLVKSCRDPAMLIVIERRLRRAYVLPEQKVVTLRFIPPLVQPAYEELEEQ